MSIYNTSAKTGFAVLHVDGGCRPTNPGPAGIACVVNIHKQEHVLARAVGIRTNNQAEYMALIVGIKYALSLGANGIEIYTDSKLILHQMKYQWYVRERQLMVLRHVARSILDAEFTPTTKGSRSARQRICGWELIWIPREKNKRADELCTQAILSNNPWIPNLLDPFNDPWKKWKLVDHRSPHLETSIL